MSLLKSGILLLVVSAVLTGCGTPNPLTEEEIPPDFLFTYERTIKSDRAIPQPEGEPSPVPEGEPTPASSEPPVDTGVIAAKAFVTISFPGKVKYELEFEDPVPSKKGGTIELTEFAFREIYDAVRTTDLFTMEKRYVGEDKPDWKESFVVRGNLRFVRIDVVGAHVPRLEELFETMKRILTDKESGLFGPSKGQTAVYYMDARNREFHRADCPRVQEIPEKDRRSMSSPERCLDERGEPCETCDPLTNR